MNLASSAAARRQLLLDEMARLARLGKGCQNCPGDCCTAKHNSMQISPAEAKDLIDFLRSAGRLTSELIASLQACVHDYRLDVDIAQFGSRRNLRRTYTCPFFNSGALGCTIAPEFKPYGCLAFNPTLAGRGPSETRCSSNQELLSQVDDSPLSSLAPGPELQPMTLIDPQSGADLRSNVCLAPETARAIKLPIPLAILALLKDQRSLRGPRSDA